MAADATDGEDAPLEEPVGDVPTSATDAEGVAGAGAGPDESELTVRFIDTSVLCNLLDVPGRNQHRDEVRSEFERLVAEDRTRFVIPVTSVIETGNHIANARGNRRGAAQRLEVLLDQAAQERTPWQLHAVTWDAAFLDALRASASTGMPLVDHLGNGTMGTGDLAILCERDAFRARTRFRAVEVWTLEATMAAYS